MKYSNIFTGLFCFIMLFSCNRKTYQNSDNNNEKAERNAMVISFLKKFGKSAFINGITTKRESHEALVKSIKSSGISSRDVVEKYNATSAAYNVLLETVKRDLEDIDDILIYHTVIYDVRYSTELRNAKRAGLAFEREAGKILEVDAGDGGFFDFILPVAKGIEKIYLSYVKSQMLRKLDEAAFRNWTEV